VLQIPKSHPAISFFQGPQSRGNGEILRTPPFEICVEVVARAAEDSSLRISFAFC
jgi:hypothetical protein